MSYGVVTQYMTRFVCFFSSLQEWYTVYEQYRRTNCVVSDLIMGNEYLFRVYAINMVGLSPEPCLSKDSAYIQKTGDLFVSRYFIFMPAHWYAV